MNNQKYCGFSFSPIFGIITPNIFRSATMIKLDLITGFLGAGKTTFLLRYAEHLLSRGERLGILAYDHGAVNVDMPLLGALREKGCGLEMLSGACDADCHRRRFRSKLIAMGMNGYDRVIIEPSGVFDMDEFFDALREPPLEGWYEPGSVIAVVDARLEDELSLEADFFLASQTAWAGCILLSRVQQATAREIEATLAHIRRAQALIRCADRPEERLLAKDWDDLIGEDFARLAGCGYRLADYVKTIAGEMSDFGSVSFLDLPLNGEQLRARAARLFGDKRYGDVLRCKGFFREGERCFQLNATPHEIKVESSADGGRAIVVIGSRLNEKEIRRLMTEEQFT